MVAPLATRLIISATFTRLANAWTALDGVLPLPMLLFLVMAKQGMFITSMEIILALFPGKTL